MPHAVDSIEEAALDLVARLDSISTEFIVEGPLALKSDTLRDLGDAADRAGLVDFGTATRELGALLSDDAGYPESVLTALIEAGITKLQEMLQQQNRTPVRRELGASNDAVLTGRSSIDTTCDGSLVDEGLIREFVTESSEHLSAIEGALLSLERDNASVETLNAIFRGFHTIKGLAGFLQFATIQELTHEVESLLDLARTGQLTITPSVVDVILDSTDALRQEVRSVELPLLGTPVEARSDNKQLLRRVREAARSKEVPHLVAIEAGPEELSGPGAVDVSIRHATQKSAGAATVRIDTAKLDELMNMVGELVIAQTLVAHNPAVQMLRDGRLSRDMSELARITSDVQRITTSMRMVPIGLQFQKTARQVRDLARKAGKDVAFESSGDDTELDKTIAEELADPLLHMVRNSIDHGIEESDARLASGKSPTARIRLSAYHQAGQIVISIGDDGKGLNREKILAKARANGIIADGEPLNESEIYQLIFQPGFSTADSVTDISGRGVGMDVVHRHVEKLRGRIEIQSTPGQGTTFFLRLPLTLAIIEALITTVGQDRYIIPIFSVREMLRARPEMISTVHERAEMATVRGSLLPVVRLHERFNVTPRSRKLTDGILIVAESDGKSFCLFVDDLVGKQEVVIKSLGDGVPAIDGVAGCAILGDGRVGLILDLGGVYRGNRP